MSENQLGWVINVRSNQSYQLQPTDTMIGRGAHNHIVIPDPAISRDHALIRRQNGKFTLIDRGGDTPIRLNDYHLERPTMLQSGDQILIGDTLLRFVCG